MSAATINETCSLEHIRDRFEEKAFNQYFMSSIVKNPLGTPGMRLVSTAKMTKAEFLRRDENGLYVENGLEAAWWSWKIAYLTYYAGAPK